MKTTHQNHPKMPTEGCDRNQILQREMRLKELVAASLMPQRNWNADPVFAGAWFEKFNKAWSLMQTGSLIAIGGATQRGKTQLAVEVARKFMTELGKSARYVSAYDFSLQLKDSFRLGKAGEVLDTFKRPSLLIIDEMSKRSETHTEFAALFEVLNHRYSAMKDTILIGNLEKDEFLDSIGESLMARVAASGGFISATWEKCW